MDFYAPWCVWCQRLAPTWEAFAEHVETEKIPIKVVKVDCVTNEQLCKDQKVHAFPTLRLFNKGVPLPPDYNTDRTVAALSSFVTRKLNVEEKRKNWPERDKEYVEHPGCMVRIVSLCVGGWFSPCLLLPPPPPQHTHPPSSFSVYSSRATCW